MVGRQAFSGMLWSKQFYLLDVERWLASTAPIPSTRTRACATTSGATCTPRT